MRRTKEWWARLAPLERSMLVYLESAASTRIRTTSCAACDEGATALGRSLCSSCSNRLVELIEKASAG